MSGRKTIQDFLSSNKVDIAKLLTLALEKTKEDLYKNLSYNLTNKELEKLKLLIYKSCLLYTSPSPRDAHESRMPSSA